MSPRKRTLLAAVTIIVVVSAIAWLNRYEYRTVAGANFDVVMRINRYTGTVAWCNPAQQCVTPDS